MSGRPFAERVVEIIVDLGERGRPRYRYGSGCIVAGRTVLTAAHLLLDAERVRVRGLDQVEHDVELDPGFVSDDPTSFDLALLELPAGNGFPPMPVAAVRRTGPTADVVEGCQAVGYPSFKERAGKGRVLRDTEHVTGRIPTHSRLKLDLLTFEVTAAPRAPTTGSAWSGMSGAPVVAGEHLLGVVTEHAPGEGDSALTVTPITHVDRAAKAAAWWSRLGVADSRHMLEVPPESARARPAYLATIEAIRARTPVLIDRQSELDDIAAFAAGAPGYRWLVGGAWAGKTSLLAEAVAANLLAGVDVVAYFLSAREQTAAGSDRFLMAVVPQLAHLLSVPAPEPTADHFRDLWKRAAHQAKERSRPLLLVVDALDEDLRPPGLPSVAALLPEAVDGFQHVLVSSRPQRALLDDSPAEHALRSTVPIALSGSAQADDLRLRAELEIKGLLDRGGADAAELAFDVFGFLAAAGAPLSVEDLAELIGVVRPERLRAFVTRSAGGSLQEVDLNGRRAYQFAHLELLAYCRADPDTGRPEYRSRIDRWADDYRSRQWPASTPRFLLDAYPALLAAAPDALVDLVLDPGWFELSVAAIGADAAVSHLGRARKAVGDAAGPQQARLRTTLLRLAGHLDGPVRLAAAHGLADHARFPEAGESLLRLLDDVEIPVRQAAAEGLASEAASPRIRQALLERAATDASARVQAAAVISLSQYAEHDDVRRLLVGLTSAADPLVRSAAANAIEDLCRDPEVLEALLRLVDDAASDVRRSAARGLGQAVRLPRVRDALLHLGEDDDEWVRSAAVEGLAGALRNPSVLAAMLRLAGDTEIWVRHAAVRKLAEQAGLHRVRAVLLSLINEPDAALRSASALALKDQVHDLTTRAAVLELVDDSDREVRESACVALAAASDDRFVRRALLARTADAAGEVRLAACKALAAHARDGEVRTAMLRLAGDLDEQAETRETACKALASAASDPEVLSFLLRLTEDQASQVRKASVDALAGHVGRPQVWDAMLRLSQDPDDGWLRASVARALGGQAGNPAARERLLQLTHDADAFVRSLAVRSLRGPAGDSTVRERLLRLSDDGDGWVRRAVVEHLAVHIDDREVRAAILQLATDSDAFVRQPAVDALGEYSGNPKVRADLLMLGQAPDPAARDAAAEALADESGEPQVREMMVRLSADPDPGVRAAAVGALGPHADDPFIRDVLLSAIADDIETVRRSAVYALADQVEDPTVMVAVFRCTGDVSHTVRLAAVRVLPSNAADLRLRAALLRLADDTWEGVRSSAAEALRDHADDPQVKAALLGLAGDDDGIVRRAAAEVLADCIVSADVLEAMLELTDDVDDWVRTAAACALAGAAHEPWVLDHLLTCVRSGGDERARLAVGVLAVHGDRPVVHGPLLEILANDRDQALRSTAAAVLAGHARIPAVRDGLQRALATEPSEFVRAAAAQVVLATAGGPPVRRAVSLRSGGVTGSCQVNSGGRSLFATGGMDGVVRIWDSDGQELVSLRGHRGISGFYPKRIRSLSAFRLHHNDLLISTGNDGTARVWDPEAGVQRLLLQHQQPVVFVVRPFTVDGRSLVATAGEDQTVRVWDVDSGEPVQVMRSPLALRRSTAGICHDIRVISLEHVSLIAGIHLGGTVCVWDLATGELRATLSAPAHTPDKFCVVGRGRDARLATAGWAGSMLETEDHAIHLWDVLAGEPARILAGSTSPVDCIGASGDNEQALLASGHRDGTVRIWDPATGEQVQVLAGHVSPIRRIHTFKYEDLALLASADQSSVRIWNLADGACVGAVAAHDKPTSLLWTGDRLVVGTMTGLRLIDLDLG